MTRTPVLTRKSVPASSLESLQTSMFVPISVLFFVSTIATHRPIHAATSTWSYRYSGKLALRLTLDTTRGSNFGSGWSERSYRPFSVAISFLDNIVMFKMRLAL